MEEESDLGKLEIPQDVDFLREQRPDLASLFGLTVDSFFQSKTLTRRPTVS